MSPSPARTAASGLADEIAELAAHVHAGTARILRLLGEFDHTEGFAALGMRSTAQWLSWRCGLSPRTARDHVRVARALQRLPSVAAEFETGRLSYAKVRAITRMADAATEPLMLEWAAHSTAAQLERVARGIVSVRAAMNPQRLRTLRRLTITSDENGMTDIHIVLPPDEGAVVIRAIEAATALLEKEQRGSAEPRL